MPPATCKGNPPSAKKRLPNIRRQAARGSSASNPPSDKFGNQIQINPSGLVRGTSFHQPQPSITASYGVRRWACTDPDRGLAGVVLDHQLLSRSGEAQPPAWSRRPACPGGFRLAGSGAIIPAIDRTYPLTQAAAAVRRRAEGRARGKARHRQLRPGPLVLVGWAVLTTAASWRSNTRR